MDVENITHHMNSSSTANGKLRMMIAKLSAIRTGKNVKETITLDTGATCSICQILHSPEPKILDVRPAPGISIVGDRGEELTVARQTDVYFSVFNQQPVRLHLFMYVKI